MHRIHVVAVNPRTGTTLMTECIRLCFDIERAEPHEASLTRLRRCKGVYLTKTPHEIDHVSLRLRLDPRFHVICMVRDPRDVVVSRHGLKPDEYWDKTSLARFKSRLAVAQSLVGNPRFMIVRFEDLIERPDGVQDEIAARFPFLIKTARFSEFHQRGQVSEAAALALNGVRPIDASNQGKWPDHIDRLRELLAESGPIDAELKALGYESDPGWMSRHELVPGPPPLRSARRMSFRRRFVLMRSALVAGAYARLGINIG